MISGNQNNNRLYFGQLARLEKGSLFFSSPARVVFQSVTNERSSILTIILESTESFAHIFQANGAYRRFADISIDKKNRLTHQIFVSIGF